MLFCFTFFFIHVHVFLSSLVPIMVLASIMLRKLITKQHLEVRELFFRGLHAILGKRASEK